MVCHGVRSVAAVLLIGIITSTSAVNASDDFNQFQRGAMSAGAPIASESSRQIAADDTDDIYWDVGVSPDTNSGLDDQVRVLAVYNGNLVAGGYFIMAGGDSAVGIAFWNGNSWSSFGRGIFGTVRALAIYDGKLIAGGWFLKAGGVPANMIASWDGHSWSPLGTGMEGETPDVRALAVFDGKLIAGGSFTTAGGVAAKYIASWNGSSWSPLEGSLPGSMWGGPGVYALGLYNGQLIVGGRFDGYIVSWNGSDWMPMAYGWGVDGPVYSVTLYNGKLIAGGEFSFADDIHGRGIAAWDGVNWSALAPAEEMGGRVWAMTVYDHKLVIGGEIGQPNGTINFNNIASWDGTSWSPLGSGTGAGSFPPTSVGALTVLNEQLIAGGNFTLAGDKNCSFVAKWTKHSACCSALAGNVDCDPTDGVDISDLSALIDNLYISFAPLCCKAEANVDGSVDGNIDISDLSALIDYLYISFTPPAACQ